MWIGQCNSTDALRSTVRREEANGPRLSTEFRCGGRAERNPATVYNTRMKSVTLSSVFRCRWALLLLPCLLGLGLGAAAEPPQEKTLQDTLAIYAPPVRVGSARVATGAAPFMALPASAVVLFPSSRVLAEEAPAPRHPLLARPDHLRTGLPRAPPV